jgi:hypothetical protein
MRDLLNKNELDLIIKGFLLEQKVDIGAILQTIEDSLKNINASSKRDKYRIQTALRNFAELKNLISRMKSTIEKYQYEERRNQ